MALIRNDAEGRLTPTLYLMHISFIERNCAVNNDSTIGEPDQCHLPRKNATWNSDVAIDRPKVFFNFLDRLITLHRPRPHGWNPSFQALAERYLLGCTE